MIEAQTAPPAPEDANSNLSTLQKQLAPECRPILSWIVGSGKLPMGEVRRLFDAGGPDGFQEDILGVAYEVIPSHARKAAKRLVALRGFQPRNGRLGPYDLFDDLPPGETALAADAALRLRGEATCEAT